VFRYSHRYNRGSCSVGCNAAPSLCNQFLTLEDNMVAPSSQVKTSRTVPHFDTWIYGPYVLSQYPDQITVIRHHIPEEWNSQEQTYHIWSTSSLSCTKLNQQCMILPLHITHTKLYFREYLQCENPVSQIIPGGTKTNGLMPFGIKTFKDIK